MRAMAAPGYGPLDQIQPIDAPLPEPGPGEVRLRVMASALNPADHKVVMGTLKFLHARTRPLIVGYDFSGTIDAVGRGVDAFGVGDDVFGFLPYGPFNRRGSFAEHVVARADQIARKPDGVSHAAAAAAATTGLTAIQAIRDLGRLPAAGRVLITGVSGGVGSIGVAVASRLNGIVTAVGSGEGLDVARRLGAVEVIDRKQRSLPESLREPFDVIFDAAAAYRWGTWRGALRPGGAFVTTLPSAGFVADKLRSLVSSTRVHFVNVKSRPEDLALLGSWLKDGLDPPVVSTIPVREVGRGLERLRTSGGRIAVQVDGGF